ncbi:MAG: hypothetical protein ACOCP8_09090, partial [archaeon]
MTKINKIMMLSLIVLISFMSIANVYSSNSMRELGIQKTDSIKEQSGISGLEKAYVVVKNNSNSTESINRIERAIKRIKSQEIIELEKLQNLSFEQKETANEMYEAKGKINSKFLGFISIKREIKYDITPEGEVKRNNK